MAIALVDSHGPTPPEDPESMSISGGSSAFPTSSVNILRTLRPPHASQDGLTPPNIRKVLMQANAKAAFGV